MGEKLLGKDYMQFVCKNLLHIHARRHPKKRLYVKDENNPNSFEDKKTDNFSVLKKMSESNLRILATGSKEKFYEYKDLEEETKK